jgi:hypothetical protein
MSTREIQELEARMRAQRAAELAREAEEAGFPDIAAQARVVADANEDLAGYHAQRGTGD